jgi:hypothetical protein
VTLPELNTALSENTSQLDALDRPIWGAAAIALAANLLKEDGKPDLRKAYYLLETGALPATKINDGWVTTPRRLRDRFNQVGGDRAPGRGRKRRIAAEVA